MIQVFMEWGEANYESVGLAYVKNINPLAVFLVNFVAIMYVHTACLQTQQ